ncbi:MAG: hypothetical protein CM1200mP16_17100 [Nitrospina sp.]|nr:MAG: hypothetical protein CM1200mP16_17100 [Nitrospina sp.]
MGGKRLQPYKGSTHKNNYTILDIKYYADTLQVISVIFRGPLSNPSKCLPAVATGNLQIQMSQDQMLGFAA